MARHGVSFLDLAVIAMEATQRPMTSTEIVNWGVRRGKLYTKGKTPAKTLHAALSRSMKNDPLTPFVRAKSGGFALRVGIRKDD